MSGSVRIYLRGHFQCSPDDFQAQLCDVDVSSDTLLSRINEGYTVIGAVAQTSNAVGLAATDSQQLKQAIALLEEFSKMFHHLHECHQSITYLDLANKVDVYLKAQQACI